MSLNLKTIIKKAEKDGRAVGHFNISDIVALKAIFEAAQELDLPVIIGTSEGEAKFLGRDQAGVLVRGLREEYSAGTGGFPIFLNSDHTHSLEEVKKAVKAGYDAILFDGGKLPFEENIKKTKEVVKYIKSVNSKILVEGELGYIGDSSKIYKELPAGVSVDSEILTTPEQARQFVKETKVDLLAPAVGNVHGLITGGNPKLDIERIGLIRKAAGVPLVLHGGSGISEEDFISAIKAGISVIHINTELRMAWRNGLERGLQNNPEEIAPYKILPEAVKEIKATVKARLKLFNKLI